MTSKDIILSNACQYNKNELHLDIYYPLSDNAIKYFVIGLMDVRAADTIRISYDFDRDGYKIEQASTFSWDDHSDTVMDSDWQEVAFIKAWAREKPGQPHQLCRE